MEVGGFEAAAGRPVEPVCCCASKGRGRGRCWGMKPRTRCFGLRQIARGMKKRRLVNKIGSRFLLTGYPPFAVLWVEASFEAACVSDLADDDDTEPVIMGCFEGRNARLLCVSTRSRLRSPPATASTWMEPTGKQAVPRTGAGTGSPHAQDAPQLPDTGLEDCGRFAAVQLFTFQPSPLAINVSGCPDLPEVQAKCPPGDGRRSLASLGQRIKPIPPTFHFQPSPWATPSAPR